jgi:hypothetical protein
MGHTIEVPTEVLRKFARASEALDEFHDAFEDFLISQNPKLLRELRRARREHLQGKTRPFAEFLGDLDRAKRRSKHKQPRS